MTINEVKDRMKAENVSSIAMLPSYFCEGKNRIETLEVKFGDKTKGDVGDIVEWMIENKIVLATMTRCEWTNGSVSYKFLFLDEDVKEVAA